MKTKNRIIILILTIIILSGTAYAEDWNLKYTSTFTGLNSTNLNVSGISYFNGNVGIGTAGPASKVQIVGTGAETGAPTDSGDKSATLRISSTGEVANQGGAIEFGVTLGKSYFAAIKGLLTDGSINTSGDIGFYTRNAVTDTGLTERIRIRSDGNVGIGTTNTTSLLQVGDSGDGTMAWANSWNVYSSETYKENIQNISVSNVPLRPVSYEQKNDITDTKMYGFIAEELPEGLKITDGNNIGINIMGMLAYQAEKINKLETKVKEQHNVNIDQQNQINTLIYEVELLKGNTKVVKPETVVSDVIITSTKPWYKFW